jgi:hypothetical protein
MKNIFNRSSLFCQFFLEFFFINKGRQRKKQLKKNYIHISQMHDISGQVARGVVKTKHPHLDSVNFTKQNSLKHCIIRGEECALSKVGVFGRSQGLPS